MTFDEILATQPKAIQDMVAQQRAEARSGGQWGLYLKRYGGIWVGDFPTKAEAEAAQSRMGQHYTVARTA